MVSEYTCNVLVLKSSSEDFKLFNLFILVLFTLIHDITVIICVTIFRYIVNVFILYMDQCYV